MVTYKDQTGGDRRIDTALVTLPDYKRFRALARLIAKFNTPSFTVIRGNTREQHSGCMDLLNFVKNEGKKDASVQRYKGLGEMNAEQLWDTTMNAETRTLLKVSLLDEPEAELMFTTLMGDDVESRRKFIEDNALDVRNLDV